MTLKCLFRYYLLRIFLHRHSVKIHYIRMYVRRGIYDIRSTQQHSCDGTREDVRARQCVDVDGRKQKLSHMSIFNAIIPLKTMNGFRRVNQMK